MTEGQWLWLLGMALAENEGTSNPAAAAEPGETKRYRSKRGLRSATLPEPDSTAA